MLVPALLTAVVALAVLGLVGMLARGASRSVWVFASGEVPPARTWLEPALADAADQISGLYSWADDVTGGLLNGHRGELTTIDQSIRVVITLQPHPVTAAVPRRSPVRVALDLAVFPARPGVARWLLGRTATPKALEVRRRAQVAIRRQLREAGAASSSTSRPSPSTVAKAGGLALLAATVVLLGPPLLSATKSAPPRPQPPPSAVICEAVGASSEEPRRSAAQTKAGCALAERTRAAYLAQSDRQEKVDLRRVQDPISKRRYRFTCTGSDLVVCRQSKVRVYLFTPG